MPRWKRAQWEARSIIGYAAMPIFLVVPVAAIVSGGWSAWPFGAAGSAALFLLWRATRSGIYVSGSGVRAAGFFGSNVLPWDELAAVEVSNSKNPQILLRTTSGAVIRTEVYRGFTGRRNDNWLRPKTFDRLVARLRELRQQEQQDR